MTFLIAIVSIFIYGESLVPWEIAWPMFDSSTNPEFCIIGFGDWCIPSEGPHPGLDFKEPIPGTTVLSPAAVTTWVYASIYNPDPNGPGGDIILDIEPFEYQDVMSGWQIGHCDSTIRDFGVSTEIDPKQPLSGLFYKTGEWFPHIHLNWYQDGLWGNNINPFNYLIPPAGYDDLLFRRIPFVDDDRATSRGIVFLPQNSQTIMDEAVNLFDWLNSNNPNSEDFQEVVYGKVDFAVAPASVDCIPPIADSMAGVREIWVDIKTLSGATTGYTERKFVDFYSTIIPAAYNYPDEYDAMFFDTEYGSSTRESRGMWHFNTTYIASNCGCETEAFETCYDNIWYSTDPEQIHDWESSEFNRGCWDTRLGTSFENHPAVINEHAVFPDDKYVIEITATSHGGDTGTRLLPAENIELPESSENIRGIIVDNYLPYVDSVIVYTVTGFSQWDVHVLYAAGWDEDITADTSGLTENVQGYLPLNVSPFIRLWVAIKYSEPMITGPGDIWITAEMRGQQEWDSTTDGNFRPEDTQSEWPPTFGPLNADGGMWQLYQYRGIWPSEYNGRLTLNIDQDQNNEHPVDLNANSIDGDPSTIAEPRNADGSWSGIGYELENDDSYTWGECDWNTHGSGTQDGYFYATVGTSIVHVQEVTFSELEFQYGPYSSHVVDADIEYNCGAFVSEFYTYASTILGHGIRVIDGDGDWVGHTHLNGPAVLSPRPMVIWRKSFPGDGSDNGSVWENKFRWIRYREIYWDYPYDDYYSLEAWYGYNGHTGEFCGYVWSLVYFDEDCPAWYDEDSRGGDRCLAWSNEDSRGGDRCLACSNEDSRGWYFINCNDPEPVYTLDVGWQIPVYYIEEGNPNPYYRGEMFAPTQVPSDNILCRDDNDESNTEVIPEDYIFSLPPLIPNPATSSVVVRYSIESAGYYEIMVYDLFGRVHAEIVQGEVTPGMHSVTWDLSDRAGVNLPAGTYLVRLTGCNHEEIQKLVLLN